jgi:hypothetical protein
MKNNVNFEFTKDWGAIKKGTKRKFRKSFARLLQDRDKVGKIVTANPKAVKPKATKPTGPENTK